MNPTATLIQEATAVRIPADRATHQKVYGWAYRLLQNHDDALDAAQEVMLRGLRQSADRMDNPGAWLRRVTINHCVDLIRRRRPMQTLRPVAADDDDAPERQSDLAALRRAVVDGLAELSDRQRAVLVAKVFDGETFAEIAAGLGMSVSSAKTHYLRGLRALRPALRAFREVTE